jgi:hypothetical protein
MFPIAEKKFLLVTQFMTFFTDSSKKFLANTHAIFELFLVFIFPKKFLLFILNLGERF